MDVRLDGRAALITGGSAGLGKAMGLKFAQSGADVAILARRPETLEEARAEIGVAGAASGSGRAFGYSCDVADAAALTDAFNKAVADMGKVDILVNNAGESRNGKFEDVTDEIWQADLDQKLFSAIRLARLALPGMKERRWGRIINVLNIGAKAPRPTSAPTSISRAAGLALTKVLAGDGAPHNVLVNALMTGLIDTDQWVRLHAATKPDQPYADFIADMARDRGIPMGRIGTAEEYANIACFLASDAGSYVTGTSINVDGGSSPVV